MFTGIIESLGTVRKIVKDRSNVHFTIDASISSELKVDQSISHNGVCLTVVALDSDGHTVTAVEETLRRTNLGDWKEGTLVNLERAMAMGGRLDGHIVQGHVDTTGICTAVEETGGSWKFTFRYQPSPEHMLVDKGSICINGVSLTVVDPAEDQFSVAIIPYTWEHTNFRTLQAGDAINLEFDVIGKYIARHLAVYGSRN
ncbi:MAG: riboflavin synthase [Lewinellaceae bacterium]|nr:riboflavin synthase [Lewinellaceae bacterium]